MASDPGVVDGAISFGRERSEALADSQSAEMARFKAFLSEAVIKYGSQMKAAEAVGIDQSRFGRVLNSEPRYGTFEVVTCLRLAKAIGVSASEVLRSAGKGAVADLIEELYGQERAPSPVPARVEMVVTSEERDIIAALRSARHSAQEGWN